MKHLIVLLLLSVQFVAAQEIVNGDRTVLGTVDNSNASATRPAKVGTTDPATCTVGEMFVNTSSTPALKLCTAANTWGALSGGGGSVATVKTMLTTSYNGNMGVGTYHLGIGGFGGSSSAPSRHTSMPIGGVVEKMSIRIYSAYSGPGTTTCTVQKNDVDTSMVLVLVGGSTPIGVYSTTTGPVTFAEDDRVGLACIVPAGSGNLAFGNATFRIAWTQ